MERVHDGQAPWVLIWNAKHDDTMWGIVEPTEESLLKAYASCFDEMLEVEYLVEYMFEDDTLMAETFAKAVSGDQYSKMECVLYVGDHEYMHTELSAITPFTS